MKKIKFRVIGKKPQNFINALYNRNIKIYNLRVGVEELTCSIEYCHFKGIQALYANSNYKIEIISAPKFSSFKVFFQNSIGILLALAVVTVCASLYSSRIWQYRIYGLQNVEAKEIVQALNEIGVKKGTTKASIDLKKLPITLIESVDGVALASANIVGTTLVITISEKIDNSALLNGNAPIVAKTTCIITKIVTTSGTALVQVGDKVAKGQTIIANYVVDSNGAHIPSKARGEISFDAYYSFSKTYYEKNTKLERTGKTQRVVAIENDKKPLCKFEKFETETKTFYLSKIIPLKVTETKYYELASVQYTIDLENDEQKLLESTKKEAKSVCNVKDFEQELVNITPTIDGGKQITITYVVRESLNF